MRQICAWCGLAIPGSPPEGDLSYGICVSCANEIIVALPNNLRDFLDQIKVPVVLVDHTGTVQLANESAREMLRKELPEIEGRRGGEVFECAYSHLPEGCGNTVHCGGCAIRRSVMQTHETGTGFFRVPATVNQYHPEHPQEIQFLISTDKFGELVMLKLYPEP